MAAAAPPPGVMPVFFTGATQQIFHCVGDQDVTRTQPFKLIPLAEIHADFRTRAAVSDFHPCKQEMMAYTGPEVLVVYDPDFTFGENFYVCLTEEARLQIMTAKEEAAKQEEEVAKQEEMEVVELERVRREPGVWKSLGSEADIAEEAVFPTRPLIKMTISRRRRMFGAPVTFSDSNDAPEGETASTSVTVKSAPLVVGAPPELHRAERDIGVQSVPELVDEGMQTNWFVEVSACSFPL